MKTLKIDINGVYDISEFVNQAAKVKGDVVVRRGSRSVDATSLMGMLSLDTTGGIEVTFPQEAFEFEIYLSKYKAS